MQKLFTDTRILDRAAISGRGLSEDILMENAAAALEHAVRKLLQNESGAAEVDVLIVAGGGDNGADGITLARRLAASDCPPIKSAVFAVKEPSSAACRRQQERAEKAGVVFVRDLVSCRVLVDCIFGSGFRGTADRETTLLISRINCMPCFRVACDIPSAGLVRADVTVTMGALKTILYSEEMKDNTGTIICAGLGLSRALFESGEEHDASPALLLEETDLALPERRLHNVNKGTFGHCAVITGDKPGAGVIAGSAAFAFGAGLVTLVHAAGTPPIAGCPFELMQSDAVPPRTTAAAIGMGLGSGTGTWAEWAQEQTETAVILDADICRSPAAPELLRKRSAAENARTVITPHPAEFRQLLQLCGRGTFTIEEIVKKRLELSETFCRAYPEIVLILKGASPLIAVYKNGNMQRYINPLGTPCLAKGGSGDVLSGLICALLAQGYDALTAALQASLAHALASRQEKSSYGMTPFTLIENIRHLGGAQLQR